MADMLLVDIERQDNDVGTQLEKLEYPTTNSHGTSIAQDIRSPVPQRYSTVARYEHNRSK